MMNSMTHEILSQESLRALQKAFCDGRHAHAYACATQTEVRHNVQPGRLEALSFAFTAGVEYERGNRKEADRLMDIAIFRARRALRKG